MKACAALVLAALGCGGPSTTDAGIDAGVSIDAGTSMDASDPRDSGMDASGDADAGCTSDDACPSLACASGGCTQTCRDDCDCPDTERCAEGEWAIPVCLPGAGACAPEIRECISSTWAMRVFRNDVNRDMADYGLFLEDALRPGCAADAREGLTAKLTATLAQTSRTESLGRTVGPFQGWLEGAHVTLIAATAAVLGGQGELTPELDALLIAVRDTYVTNPIFIGLDPGCGLSGGRAVYGNACMDDFTVSAPAWAWLAAYERLNHRAHDALSDSAEDVLARAFGEESICVHDPARPMVASGRGPCNAAPADLGTPEVEVISLNHGAQNIAYGLGLMTLVGAAVAGLDVAGAPHVPGEAERAAALGLLAEGQRNATADGASFDLDCYRFVPLADDGVAVFRDSDCGDAALHYRPMMFSVERLFAHTYGPVPDSVIEGGAARAAFRYDAFDPGLFSNSPDVFFNAARRVYYGTLGAEWILRRPPMRGL